MSWVLLLMLLVLLLMLLVVYRVVAIDKIEVFVIPRKMVTEYGKGHFGGKRAIGIAMLTSLCKYQPGLN